MKPPPPRFHAYLHFLRLATEIHAHACAQVLGANERALFEAILLAWAQDRPMMVKEALGLAHLGSHATLHKRVTFLRQAGLMDVAVPGGKRRIKYLVPTEKGLQYAERLAGAFAQSHWALQREGPVQ